MAALDEIPSWQEPNPYKKPFPIGYYGLPVLWACGLLGIAYMNKTGNASMRSFKHATDVVARAERLMLSHRELRERVGPVLSSGARDILVAEDTRVRVWFATAAPGVAGSAGSGRGFIDAFREPSEWAGAPSAPLSFRKEHPGRVNVMRLELATPARRARAAERRETAVRAGYARGGGGEEGGSAEGGGEGGAPAGSFMVLRNREGPDSVVLQVFPPVAWPTSAQVEAAAAAAPPPGEAAPPQLR